MPVVVDDAPDGVVGVPTTHEGEPTVTFIAGEQLLTTEVCVSHLACALTL